MNDDEYEDDEYRPQADNDLGVPLVPDSNDAEPDPVEPVPLDQSEATPELHSVNVPPVDEGFEDLPHEEPVEEFYEPLNPWISIAIRPRETVRYVLETGRWNNWLLVYSILFVMALPPTYISFFAQPEPMAAFAAFPGASGLPMAILFAVLVGIGAIAMYPIAILIVLLKGWLYSMVGKWLGGVATPAEARIAIVWGNAMQKYLGYLGLPLQFMVIAYYRSNPGATDGTVLLISLGMVVVMSPLWIYCIIVHCQALAEAHGFSAWNAFGASCIMFGFYVGVYIAFVIGVFALFLVLGFLAAAG